MHILHINVRHIKHDKNEHKCSNLPALPLYLGSQAWATLPRVSFLLPLACCHCIHQLSVSMKHVVKFWPLATASGKTMQNSNVPNFPPIQFPKFPLMMCTCGIFDIILKSRVSLEPCLPAQGDQMVRSTLPLPIPWGRLDRKVETDTSNSWHLSWIWYHLIHSTFIDIVERLQIYWLLKNGLEMPS